MKKTNIIIILITCLMINLATAATWQQWLPSPTTNTFNDVWAFDNGRAMMMDTTNKFYLFNGVNWSQVSSPTTTPYNTLINCDKTYYNTLWCLYANTTNNIGAIHEYDTIAKTWSLIIDDINDQNVSEIIVKMICTYDDGDDCYLQTQYASKAKIWSISHDGTQAYLSGSNITNTMSGGYSTLAYSNAKIMLANYEWNGLSWVNRGGYLLDDGRKHFYYSAANRAYLTVYAASTVIRYVRLQWFNYTSGTFDTFTSPHFGDNNAFAVGINSNLWVYRQNQNNFTRYGLNENVSISSYNVNTITTMIAADYNHESGLGWSGGVGGIIYIYNDSTSTGIPSYTLTSSANPNPVNFGSDVTFTATPINSYGEASNISVEILNSTGDWIYGWDWLNVPSGYTASTVQSGIFWNNFVAGNYTINAEANRDPWNYAYATPITWVVTSNVAQNTTIINYTWTEITPNISMTGTYSITSYGADTSYASGYNATSGNPVIMSIDHSNPANPVVRYYEINSTIKTFDLSYITSIGVYDERLYAGTDNELFVFNTSQTGKANNLVFIDSMSCGALCFRDNVLDVAAINDTFAITCNTGGILGDNNYLYNYTAGTLGDVALGISPCESVYYDNYMNLLIVNDGITTAYLFNWSNLADENVIDSGIPSGTSTHDLISHSNQYLFIITARNEVKKINISNPANTNIIATCRTDRDIQSIEAINDNELIIGKTGAISVCDFNNSATYYATGGYYIAQTIKSFTTNAIIYEISKNSLSKFLAATSEGIKIFLYGKINQTIEVNQPPTIINIGATDVSPCIGQLVKFTINAADLEGDDILYDFYCKNSPPIMMKEGFENEFGCTYTSNDLGTVTITAWAKDYIGSSITTKYQANIQVQNCTSNQTLFITAYDEGTGETIEGAFVTLVNDGQTDTTDSSGLAYFETTSTRPYSITATHPDYYDYSQSGINFEGFPIYMAKKGGAGSTTLVISVTDNEGNLMEGVTASATDISTGQNKYAFTGSNGVAIINDMFSSNNLAVSVSSTSYPTQSITTSIHIGETKYLNFTMTRSIGGNQFSVSGRGCSDFISGVWLCGNLSVTGIGNSCVTDADCISGRCNTYSGVCNNFNYTMCDSGGKYAGTGRGNTCVIKSSIFGLLSSATGNILTYFLFFMVIIVGIIIYVVLRKNGNNKGG